MRNEELGMRNGEWGWRMRNEELGMGMGMVNEEW